MNGANPSTFSNNIVFYFLDIQKKNWSYFYLLPKTYSCTAKCATVPLLSKTIVPMFCTRVTMVNFAEIAVRYKIRSTVKEIKWEREKKKKSNTVLLPEWSICVRRCEHVTGCSRGAYVTFFSFKNDSVDRDTIQQQCSIVSCSGRLEARSKNLPFGKWGLRCVKKTTLNSAAYSTFRVRTSGVSVHCYWKWNSRKVKAMWFSKL